MGTDTFPSKPFVLESLEIKSDFKLDPDEIVYLTDLVPGTVIDSKILQSGLFYLKKKNIFSRVAYKFIDSIDQRGDQNGAKKIVLYLQSKWKIAGYKIRGVFKNKDLFYNKYIQERGAAFDIVKHNLSLKRIKTHLFRLGYFNCKLTTDIFCRRAAKNCFVKIYVNRGYRFKVTDVEFASSSAFSEFAINKISGKYLKNRKFDMQLLFKAIKEINLTLKKSGIYNSEVRADIFLNSREQTVKIAFNIVCGKKHNIEFVGNKYFSNQFLLTNLLEEYIDLPKDIIEDQIRSQYNSAGFLKATTKLELFNGCTKFIIDEGSRYKIAKIECLGLTLLAGKDAIKLFFSKLIDAYYDEDNVNEAIQNLIKFYEYRGYFDIALAEKLVIPENNGTCTIKLTFDENMRYLVGNSWVEDNPEINLNMVFGLDGSNKLFNGSMVSDQEAYIKKYFLDKNIKVNVYPELSLNNNMVDIKWKVLKKFAGNKFGKIIYNSNVKVPFKKFLKEFNFKEGEPFDSEKIDSTFYALRDLDIYTSLKIFPDKESDIFGNRPVYVNGINDSKFEVRSRLGFQQVNNIKLPDWKNRSTYKIGGSLLLRNPLHMGDKLRFDVDFTIFYRHMVAQYSLPFLFNLPIRTNLRIYGNDFFQPLFKGSNDKIYKISQNGGLVGFNYQLNNACNFNLAIGNESLKVTHLTPYVAHVIKFSEFLLDKKINYFFVEPNIFYESLDNKINPSCGISFLASLRSQISTNYRCADFNRILIESSMFRPINTKMVFAGRVRIGNLFCNNFYNILPSERFYLGGSNSLRSYNPDFAPPLAEFICDDSLKLVPVGGQFMFNLNLECRIALFKSLGLAIFEDLGILKNPCYKYAGLLTATGFGLRYITPIGPVRFDIGFKPKRGVDTKRFAWFLTIGQAF